MWPLNASQLTLYQMSDTRVKSIVLSYMPASRALHQALRPCVRGFGHTWAPSYGGTTRQTVGEVFELVCRLYTPQSTI